MIFFVKKFSNHKQRAYQKISLFIYIYLLMFALIIKMPSAQGDICQTMWNSKDSDPCSNYPGACSICAAYTSDNFSLWASLCTGVSAKFSKSKMAGFCLAFSTFKTDQNLSVEVQNHCQSKAHEYCNAWCSTLSCDDPDLKDPESDIYQNCGIKKRDCDFEENNPSNKAQSFSNGYIQELESTVQQCESTASTIDSVCSNVPDGLGSTITHLLDQTSEAFRQASSSDPCSKAYQKASAVQSALSATKLKCVDTHEQCISSCNQAQQTQKHLINMINQGQLPPSLAGREINPALIQQVKNQLEGYSQRISQAQNQCQKGQRHVAQINSDLQKITQTMNSAGECAMQVSSIGIKPKTFDECRQNPNQEGCEWFRNIQSNADCNNPQQAQNNPVCFCRHSPQDPRCGGLDSKIGSRMNRQDFSSKESGTEDKSLTQALQNMGLEGFSGGEDFTPDPHRPSQQAQQGARSSSGGIGFLGAGSERGMGGGSSQDLHGNNKGKKEGTALKIINGLSRGSGGIGAMLNRILGKNSQKDLTSQQLNQPETKKTDQSQNSVDLTQFLPQNTRSSFRGVSSIVGPDGITGPFSDNFKKINNRYVALRETLR